MSPPLGLQTEIDTLRQYMAWMDETFHRAEALDDRLKLTAAWGRASEHLARLERTQQLLLAARRRPAQGGNPAIKPSDSHPLYFWCIMTATP